MDALDKVMALIAPYRKLIVAVLGLVASLLSAGILTGAVAVYASSALAIATAIGVYSAPNKTEEPAPPIA